MDPYTAYLLGIETALIVWFILYITLKSILKDLRKVFKDSLIFKELAAAPLFQDTPTPLPNQLNIQHLTRTLELCKDSFLDLNPHTQYPNSSLVQSITFGLIDLHKESERRRINPPA